MAVDVSEDRLILISFRTLFRCEESMFALACPPKSNVSLMVYGAAVMRMEHNLTFSERGSA